MNNYKEVIVANHRNNHIEVLFKYIALIDLGLRRNSTIILYEEKNIYEDWRMWVTSVRSWEKSDEVYEHRLHYNLSVNHVNDIRVIYRCKGFIESLHIEYNERTCDLFFLLHEFGHCFYEEKILSSITKEMKRNIISTHFMEIDSDTNDGVWLPVDLSPVELYADRFALMYFKHVYDQILIMEPTFFQ